MAKWVAFVVILVIPLLVSSDHGRRWLFEAPRSLTVWVPVGLGAVSGGLAWLAGFPAPLNPGKAVLVTMPLLQAVTFVALDKAFRMLTQRVPVSFDEMRFGRRPDGRRHRADIVFWLLVILVLPISAVFICAYFEIEFPSRHHAS